MVYLGGALGVNTYLMYGFFNTIPASIDEAAKIDGAGHARIFFTIILRLVAPILAVVGLLSFVGTTNEFVIASVVLISPEKQTLAVGLYQFESQEFSTNYSVFAAGAGAGRPAGNGTVPMAAEVHRGRPHGRFSQVMSAPPPGRERACVQARG